MIRLATGHRDLPGLQVRRARQDHKVWRVRQVQREPRVRPEQPGQPVHWGQQVQRDRRETLGPRVRRDRQVHREQQARLVRRVQRAQQARSAR